MTVLRNISVCLVTLAMTFNGLGNAGVVLCIGMDGHLAIEAACEESPTEIACCSTAHDAADQPASLTEEHCRDCTDLALLFNHQRARDRGAASLSVEPSNVGFTPLQATAAVRASREVVRIAPLSVSPQCMVALRTVVLRL